MARLQRALVAFLFAGALFTPSFSARAERAWVSPDGKRLAEQQNEQVRALMKEGTAAYAMSDWEAARTAFRQAWQLQPNPLIAANLGDAEIKLGQFRDGAEHLQFFLFHAPWGIARDKVTSAEQQLAECRKHVASIVITTSSQGAEVVVDHRSIGRTPLLGQIFLDAGTHVMEVKLAGYEPLSKTVTAEVGAELIVNFNLVKVSASKVATVSVPQARAKTEPLKAESSQTPGLSPKTWVVAGGAVATGISLGLGVVFRIKAGNTDSDAKAITAQLDAAAASTPARIATHSECINRTGSAQPLCDTLLSTLRKRDGATNISTGAFVAAGVFGAATALGYFLWPETPNAKTQSARMRYVLRPVCTGTASGVQLLGSF